MDNELSRLILALVLTGVVFFAWNYYRGVVSDKASGSIISVKQIEKVEVQKENNRKDLSIYKNCGALKIIVYPIYKALENTNPTSAVKKIFLAKDASFHKKRGRK